MLHIRINYVSWIGYTSVAFTRFKGSVQTELWTDIFSHLIGLAQLLRYIKMWGLFFRRNAFQWKLWLFMLTSRTLRHRFLKLEPKLSDCHDWAAFTSEKWENMFHLLFWWTDPLTVLNIWKHFQVLSYISILTGNV